MPRTQLHPSSPRVRRSRIKYVCVLALAAALASCFDSVGPAGPNGPEPVAWLRGRAVSVGGDPASGVSVLAAWGSVHGTGVTDDDGRFEVGLPEVPEGLGTVTLAPGTSDLVPAWLPVEAAALTDSLLLVLLPARWTVQAGTHEGSVVDIHPADAATPGKVMATYWRFAYGFRQEGAVQTIVDSTVWSGALTTWRDESFPIRVAIDRSEEPVNAADSVELWTALRTLETELGRSLFTPVRMEDLPEPDADLLGLYQGALTVRLDSTLVDVRGRAETTSYDQSWIRIEDVGAWSGSRVTHMPVLSADLEAGSIRIRNAEALRDHALVMHEAMHVLGVGHGCVWQSLQTYVQICPSLASDLPTTQDVAYLELLAAAREREKALGTSLGILPAIWGERVLLRGQSPIPSP